MVIVRVIWLGASIDRINNLTRPVAGIVSSCDGYVRGWEIAANTYCFHISHIYHCHKLIYLTSVWADLSYMDFSLLCMVT